MYILSLGSPKAALKKEKRGSHSDLLFSLSSILNFDWDLEEWLVVKIAYLAC